MNQLAWCDLEIAHARHLLASGHTDITGLQLAIHDWSAEKHLLIERWTDNSELRIQQYREFMASKQRHSPDVGIHAQDLPDQMFPFQHDIVCWALRRGRSAIFADCGLGKTIMQLSWAQCIYEHTSKPVLIFAPCAVAAQTQREGSKFGIDVEVWHEQSNIHARSSIGVTNYEKLHHFPDPSLYGGLVLDESSILKGFDGKTRRLLTEYAAYIPYRLACTATPAPNDLMEIVNHAEFLGIMTAKEVFAMFFKNDGNDTHKWRLKHHAKSDFWHWLSSWSVALRKPSDLEYDDADFKLPKLSITQVSIPTSLDPSEVKTLKQRNNARKLSIEDRCRKAAELVNSNNDFTVVWCGLNSESRMLTSLIPDAVEVTGSDPTHKKEKNLLAFSRGEIRVIVTKPTIAGHGLNWQHCNQVYFVGLSDSFEDYYQAIRRTWRFGQTRPVHVHVVTSDAEGVVVDNIKRKEQESGEMMNEIVKRTSVYTSVACKREDMPYEEDTSSGADWIMMLGDSVLRMDDVPSESVGLTVFSPPFPSMYVYTNSPADVGNVRDINELINHFKFLIKPLLRVTIPGRSCCIHLTQAVAFKGVDGYIGIKDFRGRVIESMEADGWIYYGEVCIDKNPQVKAIRTKDAGLLFKSLATDSSRMHMALADYILQFRKPGDNPDPIQSGISERYKNENGWITPDEWIEWAAPVWYRRPGEYVSESKWKAWAQKKIKGELLDEFSEMAAKHGLPVIGGIKETDTLSVRAARDKEDERHLCPLQLGVIERCIKLWSNPRDFVLDPFAGIGSVGVKAIELDRQFIGIELKRSYYDVACTYLNKAESQ